ncbi:MAG TPA: hypothetical protein DIC55_04860 [Streptococcus sp.]|nr:hypothetical protein [Streptococcus sp.]
MLLRRIRMSKFDILTKCLPIIQADSIGEWVIDNENDGTLERLIQILRLEQVKLRVYQIMIV